MSQVFVDVENKPPQIMKTDGCESVQSKPALVIRSTVKLAEQEQHI